MEVWTSLGILGNDGKTSEISKGDNRPLTLTQLSSP